MKFGGDSEKEVRDGCEVISLVNLQARVIRGGCGLLGSV